MIELTDKIVVEEIKYALGIKNFRAYETKVDKIFATMEMYTIGVYGPSNCKNSFESPIDELPQFIKDHPFKFITLDTPVISIYQEDKLVGVIKKN